MKILCMDWFSKFQCIGGACPLTCCSANWRIAVTEQEIANYANMDHPFAKEFVNMIDQEHKCMKTRNGVCEALTEDGWCRLVRECGDQYLSATCTSFPRIVKEYGDVTEGTVEIVCPVVAGYLMESEMIEFEFAEEQIDKTNKEIDYQIYDSLSLARTYLIEIVQSYPTRFAPGKVYIIFSILNEIRRLWEKNRLNPENVSQILSKYDSDEIRNTIFVESEALVKKYEIKGEILQKLLINLKPILTECLFARLEHVMEEDLQQNLELWLSDAKSFADCLEKFVEYQHQAYPFMTDNFLVYILFLNWITMDLEEFGHIFSTKFLEWTLIQFIAMSVWKQSGEVSKEKYEFIIASVDRMVSHTKIFAKELVKSMQALGKDLLEYILLIWIC